MALTLVGQGAATLTPYSVLTPHTSELRSKLITGNLQFQGQREGVHLRQKLSTKNWDFYLYGKRG